MTYSTGLLLLTLLPSPAPAVLQGPLEETLVPEPVEIVRDSWGVPHIYADTDEGAFYGLGYAMAEDRLFQMVQVRLMVEGRLAQYFGKGDEIGTSGLYENVQHDRKARILDWDRHADEAFTLLSTGRKGFLEAFAQGVNEYIADAQDVGHPASLNPIFLDYPTIPLDPWEGADCIGAWYRFGRHFSNLGLDEAVVREYHDELVGLSYTNEQIEAYLSGGTICDDGAVAVAMDDVDPGVQLAMASFASTWNIDDTLECLGGVVPHFSQAAAIRGSKLATGPGGATAAVLSDPRSPTRSPNIYYEASIEGDTIRVRGAVAVGTANFVHGSTDFVAWGATGLGIDQADLFELSPVSGNEGQYYLDGNPLNLEGPGLETVVVSDAADEQVNVQWSYWGPVVTELVEDCPSEPTLPVTVGSGCTSGKIYALKAMPWAGIEQDAFDAYVRMYRADNMTKFAARLERLYWPSMNVVAASVDDKIHYVANGACPVRADTFLAGFMALDGSVTASDWRTYVPQDLKPATTNPDADFVMSANHRPIGDWYPMASLYPGTGDTHRSYRFRSLLESQPDFTLQEFRDLHSDIVLATTVDIVDLAEFQTGFGGTPFSTAAQNALAMLIPWRNGGGEMNGNFDGVAVAHFLPKTLRPSWAPALTAMYGGGQPGLILFLKSARNQMEQFPGAPLPALAEDGIEAALEIAWSKLGIALQSTSLTPQEWYENEFQYGSAASATGDPIALGACRETETPWDPNESLDFGPLATGSQETLLANRGNTYSHFTPVGIPDAAESMLALGVSEVVGSPRATNQQTLWETGGWKPSPLTKSALPTPKTTVTLQYVPEI